MNTLWKIYANVPTRGVSTIPTTNQMSRARSAIRSGAQAVISFSQKGLRSVSAAIASMTIGSQGRTLPTAMPGSTFGANAMTLGTKVACLLLLLLAGTLHAANYSVNVFIASASAGAQRLQKDFRASVT